ncbi:MAG: DNA translocase FtsK [Firmicutes bacterium]|nr:DNA translocase FtsK [Bacillota bacterium]
MHKKWQQNRPTVPATQTIKKPEIKAIPQTKKIPVATKTFTPTQVPSPIHGFARPSAKTGKPIEELLAKKNLDEPKSSKALKISTEPEPLKISERQEEITKPIILSEPTREIPNTSESQKEIIIKEEVHEKEIPAVQVEPVLEKPISNKTLPFNVMMLKSDKQKLENKMDMPSKVQASNSFNQPAATEVVATNMAPAKPIAPVQTKPAVLPAEENGYIFPPHQFLVPPEQKTQDTEWMEMQATRLVEALSYFQVKGEIIQMVQGPAVTQFEMTVGNGTKVSKIRNLADDLKLALAAKDIRIQAPIPGKSSIGIEIPNRVSRPVRISEVVDSEPFITSDSPLEAALGLDLTGKPVTIDLRKMPHGLIAGATGSGKSVCINSLLISLLYKSNPSELKLLLIDPKMVELAPFNHIPHLVSPVITDVKAATAALRWAVEEMERRYQLFAHVGVRDITRYNSIATEKRQFAQKMPYLLIVIDELADLMMMAPTEVEEAICRIAQKARACGIHLVVATQRPSVDVITGLIKANIPTRIAFSVSSQVDSRTILDTQGAERLLGRGDMLYLGNGMSAPVRLQGTYVTDDEMEAIIEHVRSQGEPEYLFEQDELVRRLEVSDDQDELFEEACRFILEQGSASTSLLQRKFHIGYNRAARLVDLMEQHGYVSEQKGSKAREVFITENDLEALFG